MRELEISVLIDLVDEDLRATSNLIKCLLRVLIRIAHEETVHELLHKVVIEAQIYFLDMVHPHRIQAHLQLAREAFLLMRAPCGLDHVDFHLEAVEVDHFAGVLEHLGLR